MDDAEAPLQRRRDQTGAGGGANQRESGQIDAHRLGHRPGADHQIELEVLERRVEDFLDCRTEPVDLVDEKDVLRLEVRQNRSQVARALQDRTGGGPQRRAHLPGDDVRQGRLAQPGGPEQQHVVQSFAPPARRLHVDVEQLDDLLLAQVLAQPLRPERRFHAPIVGVPGG